MEGKVPKENSEYGIEFECVQQLVHQLKCTIVIGDVIGNTALTVRVIGGAKAKAVLEGKKNIDHAADTKNHKNILVIAPKWDCVRMTSAELKQPQKAPVSLKAPQQASNSTKPQAQAEVKKEQPKDVKQAV